MNHWPIVKLGEVLSLDLDRVEIDPTITYPMVGVYSFGRGLFDREPVHGGNTSYRNFYRLHAEHIVMSQLFGWEGALALSSAEFSGKFVSPQFPNFVANEEKLNRRYLGWYIRRPPFWEELGTKTRGMGDRRRTLNPEALLSCEIPLPPLSEQQRIVAKIEQLAAKIEEACGLRQQSNAIATFLLIQGIKKLLQPATHWRQGTIADCSLLSTGTTPPSHREEYFGGKIQWYTPGDLGFDKKLSRSSRTITELAVRDNKARLFEPETILLVAIGGSLGKVGLTTETCSSNQQITGIKFIPEVNAEFGFWWLRSRYHELRNAAPEATLPILNQKRLGAISFSYPPLDEQRRIVAYLDGLQAQVDRLKALQAQTAAELEALLPSVLDKAFEGEL